MQNFKNMAKSIETIYMVEASAELRTTQKKLLCGEDAQLEETDIGHRGVCKYNSVPIVWTETIKSVPISKPRCFFKSVLLTPLTPH